MNYFEYLNKRIITDATPVNSISVNTTGVNPFVSAPIFSNSNQNVSLNGVSIFTSAKKEDLSKIDYEKLLAEQTSDNSKLSPLEFVLKEFLSIDKIKKLADKNSDGVISIEEAREFVENLAAKDGNTEELSLADFENLINEEGIDLEAISNFINEAQTDVQPQTVQSQQQTQGTQSVQSAPAHHQSSGVQNTVAPQQNSPKTVDNMTLPELQEEKSKRTSVMSEKRAALSAVRNGQNPQVKQAKTQADIAKKKYETLLKEDPAAKKFAKDVLKNNKKIEKNQAELDKVADSITTKETEISELEANISNSESMLSSLEGALSSIPAPSGKLEDKEKDAALASKKSELTKEISSKKKEIEKQKSDLAKAQKGLEKLNAEKTKLEAEKQQLQTEKAKLDSLVKANCSSAVKAALDAFNAATKNVEVVKERETSSAQKAFDEAKSGVDEINTKIAQRQAEGVKEKFALTSDAVENAVELAESQVGVHENGSSNDSADIRRYKNGRVDGNPWCASFASWLYGAGQHSSNGKTFGYTASSQEIKRKANEAHCYASKNSNYVPKKGDLAMWTKSSSTGHVGIVSKVYADGSFDTIEGNSKDAVTKHHYTSKHSVGSGFDGFVQMDKWLA